MYRIVLVLAFAPVAVLLAACGDDASAPTTDSGSPIGVSTPLDPTEVARRIAAAATPHANTPSSGDPASQPVDTVVASPDWDGTYLFELNRNGIESELLLNVSDGALRVAQFDIANGTILPITQAPELTVASGGAVIRALIEQTWNASFPPGTGLASGRGARMQISFPRPFDPRSASVCLRVGDQDYGCYTLRPR